MWPTSGSEAIDLIQLIAALIDSPLAEAILTVPSSEMSILAPVFSTISRITLPPEPITSRILSTGIVITSMRGACGGEGLGHFTEDVQTAVLRLVERHPHDLFGDAGDLDVHLQRGHAPLGSGFHDMHVTE